jgi:hypothetical protein
MMIQGVHQEGPSQFRRTAWDGLLDLSIKFHGRGRGYGGSSPLRLLSGAGSTA